MIKIGLLKYIINFFKPKKIIIKKYNKYNNLKIYPHVLKKAEKICYYKINKNNYNIENNIWEIGRIIIDTSHDVIPRKKGLYSHWLRQHVRKHLFKKILNKNYIMK